MKVQGSYQLMLDLRSLSRLGATQQRQPALSLALIPSSPPQKLQNRYLHPIPTYRSYTTRYTQKSMTNKLIQKTDLGTYRPKLQPTVGSNPQSKLNPLDYPGIDHSTNYGDTIVCLFEFLLLQEIRKEFPFSIVSRTDFIKALLAPTVSSHLDNHFQKLENREIRKLSGNSIIRFLKTEFCSTGRPLYSSISIRSAFATSFHIKQNPEAEQDMLMEYPLDTYEIEDEYVLAERNSVVDLAAPTLDSLIQPLLLFLTGYDLVPENPNIKDIDLNSSLFELVRERKVGYWHNQPYPEILATAVEKYIQRRDGLDPGKSARGGWYPYPDYSEVDSW